jgi:AraC family transcriptional regulator
MADTAPLQSPTSPRRLHGRERQTGRAAACPVESRLRLLAVSSGLVEDLRRQGVPRSQGPEDFCPDFQICLPYRGLFVWHVAGDDVVGDPNQVVFVRAGESYRMSAPVTDGYAELIITPELDTLAEIAQADGSRLAEHPLFRQRAWRAHPQLQSCRARFLHRVTTASHVEELEAEDLVLALIRATLQHEERHGTPCGATTARLLRRTKEFLAAEFAHRILLADVGRAVGASPAYLTDLFRRVEGTSLHQYLTQLRLARALVELPHTDDLTSLALDVGFSSHSHFSAAFRRAFGCTPSQFRQTTRRGPRPSLL